jgi:hypothetical protein
MTQFSFEVPIKHLHDFEEEQDFIFALSFLMYQSPTYEEYIRITCKYGQDLKVVIDNSFNETNLPIASQEMARLFFKYEPAAVISPDADWWGPVEVANAYQELASYLWAPHRVMGVYRNAEQHDLLLKAGCSQFAIPYEFRGGLPPWPAHYLGLGDLAPVREDQPISLDTSIPIKMAIRGERFEDWDGLYRRTYPHETSAGRLQRIWDYFNCELTPQQLDLAIHNIRALKETVGTAVTVGAVQEGDPK